ncbi:hypothetical protein NLM59_06385 [Weeksellaceae bacterium KMM 9724]|uniref:hypothetical protein n=1 Tax=Profundicola chukchiensis TaxID=2961959 RepID=UPI0024397EBB|nr:hypothetical protein [Profundicola chukchiensis]MDG4950544.1 hypothetical protein [Profundicola chukchiensis]
MKKIYTILAIFCALSSSLAQVGINTETPEATLDVNGNMRLRQSPETDKTNFVLSADEEGFVQQIPLSSLNLEAVNLESATFVAGVNSNVNDSPVVLDLWTEQETNGLEGIKRYYFLGQNVSVTLPRNKSVLGDHTARVITFVVVRNNEFGGSALSSWNVLFQTKLHQEKSNSFQGGNGGVFLYDSYFGGSSLGSNSDVSTPGNAGGYRRSINLSSENSIRDKEINFYDFGGKWIMTVND